MVSAIHSLCVQNSWDVHGGLRRRETDPKWPEENVQFTPLVFPNNCASAYLSHCPNIAGYKYLTQSDARKHFSLVFFFCGCRKTHLKNHQLEILGCHGCMAWIFLPAPWDFRWVCFLVCYAWYVLDLIIGFLALLSSLVLHHRKCGMRASPAQEN